MPASGQLRFVGPINIFGRLLARSPVKNCPDRALSCQIVSQLSPQRQQKPADYFSKLSRIPSCSCFKSGSLATMRPLIFTRTCAAGDSIDSADEAPPFCALQVAPVGRRD